MLKKILLNRVSNLHWSHQPSAFGQCNLEKKIPLVSGIESKIQFHITCRDAPDFHAFLLHRHSIRLLLPHITQEFFLVAAICCRKHRSVATHVFQVDAVELAVGFSRPPLDLLRLERFLVGTPMEVSRGSVVRSVHPVFVINKIIFYMYTKIK
jgi:hypothetical protein